MKGKLFLILGPSGSGKGTAISCLRRRFPQAIFPISCTTRPPRPGEKEGEVYYFLLAEEFERRKKAGEFLEWAVVHHNHQYGTLKKPILDALAAGKIVIREVDMQGVQSVRKLISKDELVSIFITAPSWEVLKARILGRSKIPDEELAQRQKSFEREMEFSKECDYVVKSEEGKVEALCNEVTRIIIQEMGHVA